MATLVSVYRPIRGLMVVMAPLCNKQPLWSCLILDVGVYVRDIRERDMVFIGTCSVTTAPGGASTKLDVRDVRVSLLVE